MASPKLTRLKLKNFTAFRELDLDLSPGVNVFIGENATGKTHLLKVLYAACDVTRTRVSFEAKLTETFRPSAEVGRLAHHTDRDIEVEMEVWRENDSLPWSCRRIPLSGNEVGQVVTGHISNDHMIKWCSVKMESVFVPAIEMLAHSPGLQSLYQEREIPFDSTHVDVLSRAHRPPLKTLNGERQAMVEAVQEAIRGEAVMHGESFWLRSKHGEIEFPLVAEGARKLALVAVLIRNGTLAPGSILFWDEPEANLNPKLMCTLIDVLLKLRRLGVQVFLATHSYVVLKELDLQSREDDHVAYHALYRGDRDGGVRAASTEDYLAIHPNAISDTFADLYDREIQRSLGREVD